MLFNGSAGAAYERHTRQMYRVLGGRVECPSSTSVALKTAMEVVLVLGCVLGKVAFEELFKPVMSGYSVRWMTTYCNVTTALHPLSLVVLATNL